MPYGIADTVLARATYVWEETPYLKHNQVGRGKYFLLE